MTDYQFIDPPLLEDNSMRHFRSLDLVRRILQVTGLILVLSAIPEFVSAAANAPPGQSACDLCGGAREVRLSKVAKRKLPYDPIVPCPKCNRGGGGGNGGWNPFGGGGNPFGGGIHVPPVSSIKLPPIGGGGIPIGGRGIHVPPVPSIKLPPIKPPSVSISSDGGNVTLKVDGILGESIGIGAGTNGVSLDSQGIGGESLNVGIGNGAVSIGSRDTGGAFKFDAPDVELLRPSIQPGKYIKDRLDAGGGYIKDRLDAGGGYVQDRIDAGVDYGNKLIADAKDEIGERSEEGREFVGDIVRDAKGETYTWTDKDRIEALRAAGYSGTQIAILFQIEAQQGAYYDELLRFVAREIADLHLIGVNARLAKKADIAEIDIGGLAQATFEPASEIGCLLFLRKYRFSSTKDLDELRRKAIALVTGRLALQDVSGTNYYDDGGQSPSDHQPLGPSNSYKDTRHVCSGQSLGYGRRASPAEFYIVA